VHRVEIEQERVEALKGLSLTVKINVRCFNQGIQSQHETVEPKKKKKKFAPTKNEPPQPQLLCSLVAISQQPLKCDQEICDVSLEQWRTKSHTRRRRRGSACGIQKRKTSRCQQTYGLQAPEVGVLIGCHNEDVDSSGINTRRCAFRSSIGFTSNQKVRQLFLGPRLVLSLTLCARP
jgi:hypothetical protein